MLQDYWASTVIFIGIFSQSMLVISINFTVRVKITVNFKFKFGKYAAF